MATFSHHMDQFPYSPWSAHSAMEQEAFMPQYPLMAADDYRMPPNDPWVARENGGQYVDMDPSPYDHGSPPYYPSQHPSVETYLDTRPRNILAHRGFSQSSAATSLTGDSLSPRSSEERLFQQSEPMFQQQYHHHHHHHAISQVMPGDIYSSPTISHSPICVVTPRDVQQMPDVMSDEPMPSLGNVASLQIRGDGSIDVDSPHIMDIGLPTPETVSAPLELEHSMHVDEESDCNDNSGDYSPQPRKTRSRKTKPMSPSSKATTSSSSSSSAPSAKSKSRSTHKVTKSVSKSSTRALAASPKKPASPNHCPQCGEDQGSKSACERHVQSTHTRPFSCIFERYGCTATFGAKNEWKRHCSTQHLRLSFYRCDVGDCKPQNTQKPQHRPGCELPIASQAADGDCNDFNRKDLFIQHHRRMHAPEGINESSQSDKDKFKAHCEKAAIRCRVSARAAPPRTICGLCEAKGCPMTFEGPRAWETRMEHVGRHLENAKGERMEWAEDVHLKQWLIGEGLIQQTVRDEWRLTDHMRNEEGRSNNRC